MDEARKPMKSKPEMRRLSLTEEEYTRVLAERELAQAHAATWNRALDAAYSEINDICQDESSRATMLERLLELRR